MGCKGRRPTYSDTVSINYQNLKSAGSEICNIDTIRGCPYSCWFCYSRKISALSIEHFEVPIRVQKFRGKPHDDRIYRIGNAGDPCYDWKHSEELIRRYNISNFFCVTKLLNIKNFTGYFDKLQVTLDPTNKIHLHITLHMVDKILKEFPHVKIVLRILTLSTLDIQCWKLMDTAVKFANMRGLPVLETRLRFFRREYLERFSVIEKDYYFKNGGFYPKPGLSFIKSKVDKYYDCDLFGEKCKNCPNCEITWDSVQFNKKGNFLTQATEDVIRVSSTAERLAT